MYKGGGGGEEGGGEVNFEREVRGEHEARSLASRSNSISPSLCDIYCILAKLLKTVVEFIFLRAASVDVATFIYVTSKFLLTAYRN